MKALTHFRAHGTKRIAKGTSNRINFCCQMDIDLRDAVREHCAAHRVTINSVVDAALRQFLVDAQ